MDTPCSRCLIGKLHRIQRQQEQRRLSEVLGSVAEYKFRRRTII